MRFSSKRAIIIGSACARKGRSMNVPDWFTEFIWLLCCPLAWMISWVLTALLIRGAPSLGLVDYPNERKVHTQPTPRGGGIAFFVAAMGTPLLFSLGHWQWLFAAGIFGLGLLDDLRPLPWPVRLVIQIALVSVAVLTSLPPAWWLVRVAAILWITAMVNAFNMLDNMDALSGGVAGIAAGILALIALLGESPIRAEWGPFLVLFFALSGFAYFNHPPARIFMGDAGSTFLGFVLGLGSLQLTWRAAGPSWWWLVPPCILAVPCYDLLTVVLLRLSQGRSPFHADKQHLSHRLVGRGLSGWTAVRAIYLLALASGASGVLLYAVSTWAMACVVVGQLVLWWIALAVMEFATKEPSHDAQTQNGGKTRS
jgi:UDP-GlcNAc:undecaprenyl-phosphate/decaprenyl-phosphate GlcNAc-1-phosphate transferase